jgi:hypothetical protein
MKRILVCATLLACSGPSSNGTTDAASMDVSVDVLVSSDAADAGQLVPTHVLTIDYGDGYIKTAYPAAAYPWLSFVQIGNVGDAAAFHASSVKTVLYTFATQVVGGSTPQDPFWTDLGGAGTNPAAATFLHDCAGNALAGATEGNFAWYFLDWSQSKTVSTYVKDYVTSVESSVDYWLIDGDPSLDEMDDAVTHAIEPPCKAGVAQTEAQYLSDLGSGMSSIGKPILINGLGGTNYKVGTPCDCISLAETVAGGRMEGAYICPGNGEGGCENQAPQGAGYSAAVAHPIWQSQENTEIQMANAHKLIMIQGYDANVDPMSDTGMAHRMFFWASWFLTYDPETTVAWYGADGFAKDPRSTNPSGVRLYPESQIVMTNPVVPEPTNAEGIAKLFVNGAYAREYLDCFIAGARVGSCVTAVNPDETSPHPFPVAGYDSSNPRAHELVMHNGTGATNGTNGAETINGGFVTFDGPSAPASMLPDTAFIVFDTSR